MTSNRDARIKELEESLADAVMARDEIQDKLRTEESIRRKLHNQIQELKGNIRVFCRVRPALPHESADDGSKLAEIKFPDSSSEGREIECTEEKGESSLGKEIIKNHPFQFDKVNKPWTKLISRCLLLRQLTTSSLRRFHSWCNPH
jgi:kinesin family protein C1